MAQKIIVNANNKILLDNNKGNLIDMPVATESKTQYFNITSSVGSLSVSGIEREPIALTLVRLSTMYSNELSYFVYNINKIRIGKTDSPSNFTKVLAYKGTNNLYISDNDDTSIPYFVWNSANKTLTINKGNWQSFYGNYSLFVLY